MTQFYLMIFILVLMCLLAAGVATLASSPMPDDTKMWLVGQYKNIGMWEFQGIFTTEKLAVNACRDENYFVMEVLIDTEIPHETSEMPPDKMYYPKLI